jgi:nitrile hydratase subunit beta
LNGVHDIGGMDGFGVIERETDEPVFHEPWERRVFGMSMVGAGLPPITLDARRHQLERLSPVQYLSSSYYERWLARIDFGLVEAGILTREEIDRRMRQFAGDPDAPMPRREDPGRADSIAKALGDGRPAIRTIREKPRFAIGSKMVTRNLNPHGHTRLPRYARGKHGVIVAHHGAHVFPDTNAHGLGENPQHLYSVRFSSVELWGDNAEPNESVLVDLWESYLEKDKAAAKTKAPQNIAGPKRSLAKTALQARKVPARVAFSKRSLAQLPSGSSSLAGGGTKTKRRTKSTARIGRGSVQRRRGLGQRRSR